MRFALAATTAAAFIAIPATADVAAPRMSSDDFLAAVRCAAFEDVTEGSAALGQVKMQLNAEARRQPVAAAESAEAEVGAIARLAAETRDEEQIAALQAARNRACSGALVATRAAPDRTG